MGMSQDQREKRRSQRAKRRQHSCRADRPASEVSEEVYEIAVKKICEMMGTDRTTTNVQLDKIGKYLFGSIRWDGVYAADQFPDFKGAKRYAIMNLDESWMPGSHWISLIKHPRGRKNYDLLVYDSFGRPIDELIPDLKKRFRHRGGMGKVIDTEDDAEQHIQQSSCGQRSIAAIFIYDQWGLSSFLRL